jgi:hypothetical protein
MQPIWSAKTPDGTPADLAKSLLQKCIRRGREAYAVYFAKQLYLGKKREIFGCDIWRRLLIVSVEDIGPADILMPIRIADLERVALWNTFDLRRIVEAVVHLARSPKSRAVDDAIHWFDHPELGPDFIRPDYVPPTIDFLECIRSGREADAVYLAKQLYGERQQLWRDLSTCAVGAWDAMMPLRFEDLERLAKRVGNHDPDHKPDLLMIVHAAMLLCRVQKSGDHWFDSRMNYVPPTADELDRYADENQPRPDSDDFEVVLDAAKDMHTEVGRRMGRTGIVGMKHFLEHGAKLENELDVAPFQAPTTVVDPEKPFPTEGGL